MGYTASLTVTNYTTDLIQVKLGETTCMHGTGDWGAQIIAPNDSYPPQTIEASAEVLNGCFDRRSLVTYNIVKLDITTGKFVLLTSFTLGERYDAWGADDSGACQIGIENGSDGATIAISVLA